MGLRIGTALWRFWYIRGHISEGRKWLSEALEFSAEVTPALRAKALNGLGNLAGAQSDYDSARHYHTLSFELAAAIGDKVGMARALGNIANTERLLGDYDHAMSTFEQVVPLLREVGDKRNIALCLRNMGIIASGQGDSTKAQQLSQEALSIQRELGDKQSIATTLNGLGMMAVREGEYKAARAYSEECLELFRELGDRGGEARALYDMAQVVAEEGDYNTARSLLSEGLRIRYQQGTKRGVADSMRALAVVEKEQADPGRLVRLLAASEALSLALGVPISERERQRYEPWLERARTMLGPEEFDAAWGEGKALTIEKAVALALEELPTQAARTPLKNESSTPAPRPDSGLTQREIEVLRLVAAGLTNPGIASHLHVSINTVQTHLRSIFNKIDVKTRGAAVRYAFEHGLS
jgi:ATP/maltotriose-dependent transcriptional regulator MalT